MSIIIINHYVYVLPGHSTGRNARTRLPFRRELSRQTTDSGPPTNTMEPTTRRDDELAQQAPLVPDIGRGDTRADGGRERRRPTPRTRTTDSPTQRSDDELAQEAPLVPDLGRPGTRTTDATDTPQ